MQRAATALSLISFSLKFIFVNLDFMTIWIFWKISVTALTAASLKQSSLIVFHEEINVQGRLGLNLEKIHRSVQILRNFKFFEKGRFCYKFREIQVLSQIVFYKCR